MARTCAVPGCSSKGNQSFLREKKNGRSVPLFTVPKCVYRLQSWSRAVNYCLRPGQKVCVLHFKEGDVIKKKDFLVGDQVHSIPHETWRLKEDAIPVRVSNPSNSCEKTGGTVVIDVPDTDDDVVIIRKNKNRQSKSLSLATIQQTLNATFNLHSWAWTRIGEQIVFTLIDKADLSIRLRLVLLEDFSMKIQSLGREFKLSGPIREFKEIFVHLRAAEALPVCVGTGVDSDKRHPECLRIFNQAKQYPANAQYIRCSPCQSLRQDLQNKMEAESKKNPSIKC